MSADRTRIEWIIEHEKCNMDTLYDDFHRLAKIDVEMMNDECRRKGYASFSCGELFAEHSPHHFIIEQNREKGEIGRYSTFVYDSEDNAIRVKMERPNYEYTITTRWDKQAVQCHVIVTQIDDGKPIETTEFPHHELWKVVQYVLEPFFFPCEDTENLPPTIGEPA